MNETVKTFDHFMGDAYVMPDHPVDISDDIELFYDGCKLRKNSKEYKRFVAKINNMMTVVNNKFQRQYYKLIEID